ncbi:DNA cytosine methyltransferase [Pseudocolwellia agarivorans]|uniref:DNA cytosine methyltransferase n=1 Tax=Pseudocolwellia agarivorans TaxID=1911682 RepID=UPI0009852530|nr:DNA cytosine methyltransferase [Pseudocolwellia agarivorans]
MKVVDLFSGCGGMTLGFQNCGYSIQAAYDHWEPAVEVYKKNFTHPAYVKDLSDESVKDELKFFEPDILIGGPPCQDFSSAGQRNENGKRADLTVTFSNIVSSVKPKFFVMENVSRITKSGVLKQAKNILKQAGYGLTETILDASLCGVPQKRKRFFLIGHLGGEDHFLSDALNEKLAQKPMSIFDYLGDSLGVEYYFRIPLNYNRRAIFSIYEPCVTIRGVDRPIPKGYKKHPGDLVEIGDKVRALTVKERSYIQTFPEEFNFFGTKTNLNLMIGNAVPVKLAEYVGSALKNYIKKSECI